ncbi:hypothetical protein PIB30_050361 [Stylosanthes scabra]|uniref:Uncharacterized protein n=1 Tax=Stylosanthes scabra TaxID=79078 RepID=A0ABU6ZGA9_9FABA|nr:hypothetical protein [Stylosanthes scabra]
MYKSYLLWIINKPHTPHSRLNTTHASGRPHVCHRQPLSPTQVQKVDSSFTATASSTPCRCAECLVVAFHRHSSSRASMKEKQYTLNATVTPLRKTSIDFSTLDEKLGEGVAEFIWIMIRDAVAQEMHGLPDTAPSAELSDVPIVNKRSSRCKGIKRGLTSQVKRTLLYEEKLPPGRPWLYYSAYDPQMDEEDMPHCLDLAFRPTKGMKFFGSELAFAAYIFGNNLNLEEELVTNAHCYGTRKTLRKLMPGKPINGDVLVLVCSMLTYGAFGIKTSKLGSQWYLPPTFSLSLQSQICMSGSDDYNPRKLPTASCTYSSDKLYQMQAHLQSTDSRP